MQCKIQKNMCSHQHKTLHNEFRCNKVHTRLHFLFKCGCCELWEVLPVKKDDFQGQ